MAHLSFGTLCNNNCINCINTSRKWVNKKALLNVEACRASRHTNVGGGEPTMHPDFFQAIKKLDSFGKEYTLLTNARAFASNAFTQKFHALQLDRSRLRIATAIYSSCEKIHDDMTRTPGSFRQAMTGLKSLMALDYRIELRLILTKMNAHTMKNTASMILDGLPHAERVVIISHKLTGEALRHKDELFVSYEEAVPHAILAIDMLAGKLPAFLFHFPHCILPEDYWKYSKGRTVPNSQIMFKEECDGCMMKKRCSGIWKSYAEVVGTMEFRALK